MNNEASESGVGRSDGDTKSGVHRMIELAAPIMGILLVIVGLAAYAFIEAWVFHTTGCVIGENIFRNVSGNADFWDLTFLGQVATLIMGW